MKNITFYKANGAGNDFVVIDKKANPQFQTDPLVIKKLCDRRYGIGADGVITIDDSNEADFVMTYYNSDGSLGTLCGNGARCSIRCAEMFGKFKGGKTEFLNNGKRYKGEALNSKETKFYLNAPENLKLNFKINVEGNLINASFIDTGSPHIVININDALKNFGDPKSAGHDISEFPVFELGSKIRYHKDFAPAGVNVNFIQLEKEAIKIRTYERGVEDETYACGTGSAAAALIAAEAYGFKPPIKLYTKMGNVLIVDFNNKNDGFEGVSLTGPALVSYTGEFNLDFIFNLE